MRRRITTLLILLMLFGNIASAEWIPLWQSSEKSAVDEGLERVHSISAEWNGFPLLDDDLNVFIKSMLANTTIEYTSRKSEDVGYARWDWLLQKRSVLDFSEIVQDGLFYEQSNLFGGQTVAFTKREFSSFVLLVSRLSQGLIPNNLDIFFDIIHFPLLDDIETLDTLQEALRILEDWKAQSIVVSERARPRVALPGLFGTKAVVYQISRADLLSLLENLSVSLFPIGDDDTEPNGTEDDSESTPPETREALLAFQNALSNPAEALLGLLPEDMSPIEFREIFCYEQSVSKQMEIRSGSNWLLIEWADQYDSIAVSIKHGDSEASALFTFEEGPPVVTRKLQSAESRSLLEIRLWFNDIRLTAYRTGVQTFENTGTKETIKSKVKWTIDSEALFENSETLILSLESTDVATGESVKYQRTRETNVLLSGIEFDGKSVMKINETVAFRKPSDTYFAAENILHPGQMPQQTLEAWLESLRNDALQVCFTILGRVPSENAQFLLALFEAAR